VKGDGKGNFKGGDGKGKGGNFKGSDGGGKGGKEGTFTKGPRSYDKHSQGVTSRQFQAKKQGHGKSNWDDAVPAGLNAAPVKDALANESLATPAGTSEVDGWGDTPSTAPTTEGAPADAPAAAADVPASGTPDQKKDADDDSDEDKKTYSDYLKEQAEKKAALEAVVGKISQPRQLSDDEKKALTKFTLVENTKVVKKPEPTKAAPKPAVATTTTTTPAPAGGARKGETAVPLASVLNVHVAGARAGPRRGPRPEGSVPRDNAGRAGQPQRKGGRGPQKIPKGKNDFPQLGPK